MRIVSIDDDGECAWKMRIATDSGEVVTRVEAGKWRPYSFIAAANNAWSDDAGRSQWLIDAGNQMAALRPDLFKNPEGA